MSEVQLVDAHCHVHEYDEEEIRSFGNIRIAGVAMDLESSGVTLELAKKFGNIDPFVGLHPWNLHKNVDKLEQIKTLAVTSGVAGLGEVGVDVRFAKASFKEQLNIFKEICGLAVEHGLPLNVHALGGWDDVLNICVRLGVKSLLLHWYTGPVGLLKVIRDAGYFISINPAIVIQQKQMQILREADINVILTESDGPYSYRGLNLSPRSLPNLVQLISEVKNLTLEETSRIIYDNYLRFLQASR
ncbi:MAG: TatD family hydrolase [Nitrososphaerota archaeon]|nr:TatD family hydrolase [Candidatus Calditenuaceae archaeon]MDW8072907.1 TatD family hydrolase [Nitrososphaerota archaeon]